MSKAPHSSPNEDAPKKKRRGTSVLAWVLMAMLIGGLGGFGVQNFGGRIGTIGKVGETEISTSEYGLALRNQINAMSRQFGTQLTMEQAQALGLDRQVLQSLLDRTALDNEAGKIGLSAGDEVVAGELAKISAFQGTAGSFDRKVYGETLKQNGTSESEFEAGLRRDVARKVLEGSISGGFATPAVLTDTLYAWAGETRSFSLLRLTETDLTEPLASPTDDGLKAYYDTNIARYTRPEAKRISYAALLPETLAPTMQVAEEDVRKAYEARLSEFVIPEKRLVERLAFGTEAEAAAAKARLDAGETFETLVTERKLTLEDIDMGDVTAAELGDAGAAVFALTEPGVVGPFASDLGPAIFRMNAILAAQETTYDQARPDLLLEQQMEAARKAISDKVEAIDDALAGGASLQELATDHGMTLGTTDYAPGADDNDPIAGYAAFRDSAEQIGEGDFPEALVLEDGGLVSMQLLETVPPTAVPFEKIKDKVTDAWHAEALAKALADKGQAVKADVEGGATFDSQGTVEKTAAIDREGSINDAPPSLLQAVFEMTAGEIRVIEAPGFAAVVLLDAVEPAATTGDDATAMREAIAIQARKAFADDVFSLYTGALTAEAGITLDQTAINAVNTQLGR